MRNEPTNADMYHLHLLIDRMERDGRSEDEIVEAVAEADDRTLLPMQLTAARGENARGDERRAA